MLNYEVKFISFEDFIYLKSNDFNCFKYETNKRLDESIYEAAKRSYLVRRGGQCQTPRPRQIRQLKSKLRDKNIITCEWSNSLITIVFSSGVIAYLSYKHGNLDIAQVLFDRYFVGKLPTQITSVALCKQLLFFTHADKTATLVTFGKTTSNNHPCRISDRDPHLQTIELGGSSRKTERHVTWSEINSRVLILVWSVASHEPAPWSPVIEDCANLHLYQIIGQQMHLVAYHQLENETLAAELSCNHYNVIHIVEQSAGTKNGIGLDWVRYEIGTIENTIKLTSLQEKVTRAILTAPARTTRKSACDMRLLAACIDGSLHIIHHVAGLTHSVKTGFIANDVRWSGQLVVCADEIGRLHCFDRALSLVHNNAKWQDIAQYLRESKKLQILATNTITCGSCILAYFSGGPILFIRIMHPRLLTAWIRARRTSNAVALLQAMDWETEGTDCLWAVNKLVCAALRSGAEAVAEEGTAQAALGAFLAPPAPHCPKALRYAPHITDLARKFFHHLLRRGRIEKALSLAVDLGAWDLFVDVRFAATRRHLQHLANEAASLAATYATHNMRSSECSDSCSRCSSGSYSDSEEEPKDKPTVPEIAPPPLPRVAIQQPHLPALVPVPRTRQEAMSTSSIRPNLHQYLDKDDSIWSKELRDDSRHDSKLVDLKCVQVRSLKWTNDDDLLRRRSMNAGLASIRENYSDMTFNESEKNKPREARLPITHLRQAYRTNTTDMPGTLYRYRNNIDHHSTVFKDRRFENNTLADDRTGPRTGERYKVKFSDTVTVAIVSDPPQCPEPARELAESLPLCAPHNYLAAFTPLASNIQNKPIYQQQTSHQAQRPLPTPSTGTPLDYVEV